MPLSEALNDIALDMRRARRTRTRAAQAARAAPRDLADRHHADRPGLDHPDPASRCSSAPTSSTRGSSGVAERIRARGERRRGRLAGVGLPADPQRPRRDPAGHGRLAAGRGRRPRADRRRRSSSPRSPSRSRCATGTASARRSSATRPTWRPSSCWPTLILLLTGVDTPVLLLHARHRAARRAGLRLAGRRAVLGDADRRLRLGRASVRDDRTTSARRSCCRRFYPLIAAAGAGAARPARPPGGRDGARRAGAHAAAQAERERLARDMHDSLAKTVSGIGFAALALARRIERDPAGAAEEARAAGRGRARRPTREARELHHRAARRRRRAAAAADRAAGRGAALGRRDRRRASAGASRTSASCHPVAARELEWILREALGNVERHARATHGDGAAAAARRAARC